MRLVSVTFAVALLALSLAACTSGEGKDFDDVPAEPALNQEEQAALPTDEEAIHHAELEAALAAEVPEDDASNFDTDDTTNIIDGEVFDDEAASAAPNTIAFQPLLHSGLHPRASDALRAAGVAAWRITQTIGNAPASAGTHAADGSVNGRSYSAATDISVSGLSTTQIHNLLEKLAKQGFAVWYRKNGADGWSGANHMHMVYANCKMKSSLRSQVRSWLAGRNGLVSNTTYRFHTFSASAKATVKAKYEMSKSGTTNGGAGVPGRVNTAGAPLNVRSGTTLSSAVVGSVADGAYVTISCQKTGASVKGTYGTTTLWDKIGSGYVSDAFISTGSDGRVAPNCP
ncbi:MAG: hypothetical protein HOV81_08250 [Kofleriaceae bacterium]|nr:hypothetical protein [Kofleriaceae bacterium]